MREGGWERGIERVQSGFLSDSARYHLVESSEFRTLQFNIPKAGRRTSSSPPSTTFAFLGESLSPAAALVCGYYTGFGSYDCFGAVILRVSAGVWVWVPESEFEVRKRHHGPLATPRWITSRE